MFKKEKPRNSTEFNEILEEEFITGRNSLLDSISMQIVLALNLKISFLCKSVTEIITDSMPWIFMFPVTLKNYKLPFKFWEYYFNIIGVRSCIPQYGHSFRCYRDSNGKIIDLLGWERLMELEFYIATKNLGRALPFATKAKALRTIPLFIKGGKERYHLIAVYNIFPDEPVKVDSKEILSCTSKAREFLFSLFNKEGEQERAGTIDSERLIEVCHRYQNPPREP